MSEELPRLYRSCRLASGDYKTQPFLLFQRGITLGGWKVGSLHL
jgi:hypothetical protein